MNRLSFLLLGAAFTASCQHLHLRRLLLPAPVTLESIKVSGAGSHFTVHVARGGLAFVRADATLIREGQARTHNIDYFTLISEDGEWKFLSASYVATPIPKE